MSYGTPAGVAAHCKLWTRDGAFYDAGASDTATKPTLTEVTNWLDQVSAMMDSALADEAFETPVTLASVVKELTLICEGLTKDLVDHSHKAGRFYAERAIKEGVTPWAAIAEDIQKYVQSRSVGFDNLGLPKISGKVGRKVASFDVVS